MVDKLIAAGADVNSAFALFIQTIYREELRKVVSANQVAKLVAATDKLIAAGADVNTTCTWVRECSIM